jgi:hypothetical protein
MNGSRLRLHSRRDKDAADLGRPVFFSLQRGIEAAVRSLLGRDVDHAAIAGFGREG